MTDAAPCSPFSPYYFSPSPPSPPYCPSHLPSTRSRPYPSTYSSDAAYHHHLPTVICVSDPLVHASSCRPAAHPDPARTLSLCDPSALSPELSHHDGCRPTSQHCPSGVRASPEVQPCWPLFVVGREGLGALRASVSLGLRPHFLAARRMGQGLVLEGAGRVAGKLMLRVRSLREMDPCLLYGGWLWLIVQIT